MFILVHVWPLSPIIKCLEVLHWEMYKEVIMRTSTIAENNVIKLSHYTIVLINRILCEI